MFELVPGEGAKTPPPPSSCFTINLWPKYFNIASIRKINKKASFRGTWRVLKAVKFLPGIGCRVGICIDSEADHSLVWLVNFTDLSQWKGGEVSLWGLNEQVCTAWHHFLQGFQVTAVMKIPRNSLDQVWGRIVARVDLHLQKGFLAQSAGKTR